ncbi:hypothetical protein [Affinirhizobium pseudoryzae]|uniref:hypothetical protein n=1 Tax=Allorhizobium pseudoryzae TaxID=379684 RepID=UPI0013EABD2F|nr:hypothetical protein [Allorhizobium pseudoryzae]
MTSIRTISDESRTHSVFVILTLALATIALVSGSTPVTKTSEPAFASKLVAPANSFRILAPHLIEKLSDRSATAIISLASTRPGLDEASCIAERAATKTSRHVAIDPQSFCRLQTRLVNAELIGRKSLRELASVKPSSEVTSEFAFNHSR